MERKTNNCLGILGLAKVGVVYMQNLGGGGGQRLPLQECNPDSQGRYMVEFMLYKYNPSCRLSIINSIGGCGLTDGEVMEQLWSYLRRMTKTTKEMRPSHCVYILTCGLLLYADKSRQKLQLVI